MSEPTKPTPEMTRLKLLPAADQAAIFSLCEDRPARGDTPAELGQSLEECRANILLHYGIELLHDSQLSRWRSWYRRQQQLEQANQIAEEIATAAAEGRLQASPEEIRQFQLRMLTVHADATQSTGLMLDLAKELRAGIALQIKREALALNREKFAIWTCEQFLRWHKDEKAREIADSNLSNADKIARLRETYFADVDALERAGTVELPE